MSTGLWIIAAKIAGSVILGVAGGFLAIYIFNRMPASWLCDYGETPDPILSDPQVQRIKGFPWRWIYAAGFVCLLIRLSFVDLPFAAAGWANSIEKIRSFMKQNCDMYFSTVQELSDYLK